MIDVVLLLTCHEESFLVLLFEEHELHLVVLESVIALLGICFSSS